MPYNQLHWIATSLRYIAKTRFACWILNWPNDVTRFGVTIATAERIFCSCLDLVVDGNFLVAFSRSHRRVSIFLPIRKRGGEWADTLWWREPSINTKLRRRMANNEMKRVTFNDILNIPHIVGAWRNSISFLFSQLTSLIATPKCRINIYLFHSQIKRNRMK